MILLLGILFANVDVIKREETEIISYGYMETLPAFVPCLEARSLKGSKPGTRRGHLLPLLHKEKPQRRGDNLPFMCCKSQLGLRLETMLVVETRRYETWLFQRYTSHKSIFMNDGRHGTGLCSPHCLIFSSSIR